MLIALFFLLELEIDIKKKAPPPTFIYDFESRLNLWTMYKKSLDKSTIQIKFSTMDKMNIVMYCAPFTSAMQ